MSINRRQIKEAKCKKNIQEYHSFEVEYGHTKSSIIILLLLLL